jgi:DNA recombination protein RmuC
MSQAINWLPILAGVLIGACIVFISLRGRAQIMQARIDELSNANDSLQNILHEAQQKISHADKQLAVANTTLEAERKASVEKMATLQNSQQQLSKEFENLANRIFDDKQQRFNQQSRSLLEASLSPLRQQLGDFKKQVDNVYEKDSEGRQAIIAEVKLLQQLNQSMNEESRQLVAALKGENKLQGDWGETILERVLEQSGLTNGREFETQVSLTSANGKQLRPDVLIRLPEQRCLIVDAKVSLKDYEKYINADNDVVADQALKQHLLSMRQHIDGLSQKDYEFIEGINAPEFVFVFVPIEAAYRAVIDSDASVFTRAYEKNVVVVSPATLLATLRTVQFLWRRDNQNRNAEKIAAEAGGLYDQLSLVAESLLDLGKNIQRTNDAYEATLKRLSEGRGNAIGRVEKLQKLGAKVKRKMPMLSDLQDIDDLTDEEEL